MELRHLYTLSEVICKNINSEDLPLDMLDNMEIQVTVAPTTFYGIDKEFYYLTHNSSYSGFVHSEVVNAKINGVKFRISPERVETTHKETVEII